MLVAQQRKKSVHFAELVKLYSDEVTKPVSMESTDFLAAHLPTHVYYVATGQERRLENVVDSTYYRKMTVYPKRCTMSLR